MLYVTIGEYDYNYTLVEDYDYWLRIFAKFNVTNIEEVLYSYRFHSAALTSTERADKINSVCEEVILKNRPSFGRLNALQKYYLYSGLHECRQLMLEDKDKYKSKYKIYSTYYLLFYRVPNKIKKILKK